MINIKGVIGEEYPYVKWLADLKNETGPVLEVSITSPGGRVDDGLNILSDLLDAAASGRSVITRVSGECASIASVIFMGGTERVVGCPLVIHNPWTVMEGDASSMETTAKELRAIEKQLEQVYADRSGLSRERISKLMDAETWILPAEAVALGFATRVADTFTATRDKIRNLNISKMDKKPSAFERLRALLDARKKNEKAGGASARLVLETTDGQTLTVEREEGEPRVGDAATPDGTFPVTGTVTIVVEGGVITEIIDTANPGLPGEEDLNVLLNRVEELEAEVVRLRNLARTPEDVATLNAVRVCGGIRNLVSKAGRSSSYAPAARENKRETPRPLRQDRGEESRAGREKKKR